MAQGKKWVVYSVGVVVLAVIVMLFLPHPGNLPPPPDAPAVSTTDASSDAPMDAQAEPQPVVAPPTGTWTWPDPPEERRTFAAETSPSGEYDAAGSIRQSASSTASESDDQPSPTQSYDSLEVIPFPEDSEVSAGAEAAKSDAGKEEVKPTGRNSALRAILERKGKR